MSSYTDIKLGIRFVDDTILIPCNDIAVDLCLPHNTAKGLGYYNLETREAIEVVKDRCRRRMMSMESGAVLSGFFIVAIHLIFPSVLASEGSLELQFWIVYIGFGFIFFPMLLKMQMKEITTLEETLENAKQYDDVNVMEGGGYALYNEKKKPRPKDLIGAASCGYIDAYQFAARYVHIYCPPWSSFSFSGTLFCVSLSLCVYVLSQ